MNLKPIVGRMALLAVAALIVTACGPTSPAPVGPSAPAPPPATAAPASAATSPNVLRVGEVRGTAGHALFVAKGRGYFEKQGLDVQLVEVSSGAELLPLLASGQLDAGVSSAGAALFNAIANNVPLKAVVDLARNEPGAWWGGLVVRPDLLDGGAIKTPADLRAKTIAVTGPGTSTYMNTIRLLEANDLTEKDVNIVSMPFPDMISALASRNIDVAAVSEPTLTVGQDQGVLRRWVSNAEINPGEQEVVMTITPGLAGNREVADRFVLALVQAIHDYRAAFGPEKRDQEAVVGAMLPWLGTNYTADTLRRMAPVGMDPDGLVNRDSIKDQQDWYVAHGLVKKTVDVDAVVDNSFAERAGATLAAQR